MPGGLARTAEEMTQSYVDSFTREAIHRGISFVAAQRDAIVGEIHAYVFR